MVQQRKFLVQGGRGRVVGESFRDRNANEDEDYECDEKEKLDDEYDESTEDGEGDDVEEGVNEFEEEDDLGCVVEVPIVGTNFQMLIIFSDQAFSLFEMTRKFKHFVFFPVRSWSIPYGGK